MDGKSEKFSIYDALNLVSRDDWEASLPPEQRLKEKADGEEQEQGAKTPTCNKSASKKRGKAPRFSTPKNLTLKQVGVLSCT